MAFMNKTVSLSREGLKEIFRGNSTPKSRGRNRSQSEDIRAIAHEENAERHHPARASDLRRRMGEDEEEHQHSSPDVDNSDEICKSSPKPRRFSRSLSRSRRNAATRPLHSW